MVIIKKMIKMRKNIIIKLFFIALVVLVTIPILGQTKSQRVLFSGTVMDVYGNPLSGADISVADTDLVAVTNANGEFELNVFSPTAVLTVSAKGYLSQSQKKGERLKADFVLVNDISNRNDIVETTYQRREAYALTTAVTTISGDELVKTPAIHLGAALAGRLPGLLSRQFSAEQGSESYALSIRGIGTTNGRTPLILIDGVPASGLSDINPHDVASVSIYKDGAANVLYGMQAGNGAISVITKSGNFGKPRIKVNVDQSYHTPLRTPEMINSYDFALMRNQAYKNDGFGDYYAYSDSKIDGYKNGDTLGFFPNNNWYEYFMKPMVQSQRVLFSATGGFDGVKYYTSVGYNNVGGSFNMAEGKEQKLDRIDFRTNVDVRLNKFISSKMKIAGSVRRRNGPNANSYSILSSIFNLSPTLNGPLTPDGKVVAATNETNPPYGSLNRSGYLQQTQTRMNAILGLDFDMSFITKGLKAELSAMFDANAYSNITGTTGYERWIRDENRNDSLIFIKQGTQLNTPLSLTKAVSSSYMTNVHAMLKYNRSFDNHNLYSFAFVRYQHENLAETSINGILPYQRLTYGFKLGYGYSNFLFADLAASYEGSEQFAPEHRFGLFPAASLAWVVSNNEFLKDNELITYLKAKASIGLVGNDQFGNERFMYRDNINRVGTGFIAALGTPVEELQAGNRMLTWEKSLKSNVGVEVGLFNQFSFGFDLYNETTKDILSNMLFTPASQGIPTGNLPMSNIGVVNNKGFEVMLGYSKSFNKDLSLSVSGYIDFNQNKVIESAEVELGEDYAYAFRQKGYSMGQNWGYVIDKSNGNGYFNSQEEITNSGLIYEGGNPRPGDFIYKDLNGDNIINQKDMAPMGNPTLPKLSWGATCTVKWRNFDIYALLQGVNQVSQFNTGVGYYDFVNNGTYFNIHKGAWTKERYDAGLPITAPALSATASTSNRANDYYLADKSYVRLKNVEIGYSLPARVNNVLKTQAVRLYLSGNNLLTLDRLSNKDVDVEMNGYVLFPINRTYNLGISLTF